VTNSRLGTYGLMTAASLALHAGSWVALARLPEAPATTPAAPVEVAFEVAPPPPPAPVPAPAAPDRPRHVPAARLAAAPREALPPPPNEPLPSSAPKAPRPAIRVGVSLSSTAAGGAFAVGVGNTLYGRAGRTAADPADVKAYAAQRTATERPSSLPRALEIPKIVYPERARREGVAGQVVLILQLDARGAVVDARVVSEPGAGLGAAAREGALRFRFAPAVADGTPVETSIRFTYTFVLE
jgi:periplasmic protein TonB